MNRSLPSQAIPVALLVLSVGLNIAVATKLQRLRQFYEGRMQLREGSTVPALAVRDRLGAPATVFFSDPDQTSVLYFFSRNCGACNHNLPNLQSMAAQLKGRYRFIPISIETDDLKGQTAKYGLDMPIYFGLDGAAVWGFKVFAVPQTTVVDGRGRVLKSWVGPYEDAIRSQVEQYFRVKLPAREASRTVRAAID